MQRWLTTGEIAKLCHVCPRTVAKWIDSGRLKGFRIPSSAHRRVAAADFEAFVRKYNFPHLGANNGSELQINESDIGAGDHSGCGCVGPAAVGAVGGSVGCHH